MPRTLFLLLFLALGLPAAAGLPAAGYQLGPLDQIEVNVASFPDLRTVTRIGADGAATLPLVGPVKVAGLTSGSAAEAIARAYAAGGYVKAPSVRVDIIQYESRKASVLGQVVRQGMVALDRSYTVAELIAAAGGFAPDAAEAAVITRRAADGGSERIDVDLGQFGNGAGAMTVIEPGDIVFVPRTPTFSIIGQVARPGNYRLTSGMSVQQALATAGDITRFGTLSGLKVRRQLPGAASTSLVPVELDDSILPGDVLIVRERLF